MQLKDNDILGLVVWGTKGSKGKAVIFSSNIADSADTISSRLTDIQGDVSYQGIDHEFYRIDNNPIFKSLSIIHSIHDSFGRPGFIAITIVIPQGKTFEKNNSQKLLQKLMKLYLDNYVETDIISKKIKPSEREDVVLFEEEIRNFSYKFIRDSFYSSTIPKGNCYLKYKNETELDELFQNFNREDLKQYEKILLLPGESNDLTENVNFTELAPVQKKIKLRISVRDEVEDLIYGAMLLVTGLGNNTQKFACDIDNVIDVPNGTSIIVKAEKEGYESNIKYYTASSSPTGIFENDELLIKLSKIKKTEKAFVPTNKPDSSKPNGGKEIEDDLKKSELILKFCAGLIALLVIMFLVWYFIFPDPLPKPGPQTDPIVFVKPSENSDSLKADVDMKAAADSLKKNFKNFQRARSKDISQYIIMKSQFDDYFNKYPGIGKTEARDMYEKYSNLWKQDSAKMFKENVDDKIEDPKTIADGIYKDSIPITENKNSQKNSAAKNAKAVNKNSRNSSNNVNSQIEPKKKKKVVGKVKVIEINKNKLPT